MKTIELTDDDVFWLQELRSRAAKEMADQHPNDKLRGTRGLFTETSREAQHHFEVLNRILSQ